MRGQPTISRIYEQGEPQNSPDEAQHNLEAVKRKCWKKRGLFVIDPADVDDDWLRQAMINEANRRYG